MKDVRLILELAAEAENAVRIAAEKTLLLLFKEIEESAIFGELLAETVSDRLPVHGDLFRVYDRAMLHPSPTGKHTVVCDTCGDRLELDGTFDEAFDGARAADWLDHARRGVGRKKWEWSCPKCRPRGGGGMGPSVGAKPGA